MGAAVIASPDNPQFKQLKKLATSARERRKLRQTLLEGMHLLQALADAGGTPQLIALRAGVEETAEVRALLRRFPGVRQLFLSAALFDAASTVVQPTGVMAVMAIPPAPRHGVGCIVLLEAMQDPGNVGTILRTAAAAGVDAVYLSGGCAEAWSPKVLRAAMGAHFVLALHEHSDLVRVAQAFDGRVVATSLDAADSLYDLDLDGPTAFVFGNEGAGLSAPVLAAAHQRVRIPMPGRVESLNAAAAAAVCLFERVRQMRR